MAAAGAAGSKLHAARVTDTGLLYLQPKSAAGMADGPVAGAAAIPAGPQFAPGFRGALPDPPVGAGLDGNATGGPAVRQPASRKLLQPVGSDERWEVTSPTAHAFPWRAVGYIASGCSGSLIGPSTVLTAGHVSRAGGCGCGCGCEPGVVEIDRANASWHDSQPVVLPQHPPTLPWLRPSAPPATVRVRHHLPHLFQGPALHARYARRRAALLPPPRPHLPGMVHPHGGALGQRDHLVRELACRGKGGVLGAGVRHAIRKGVRRRRAPGGGLRSQQAPLFTRHAPPCLQVQQCKTRCAVRGRLPALPDAAGLCLGPGADHAQEVSLGLVVSGQPRHRAVGGADAGAEGLQALVLDFFMQPHPSNATPTLELCFHHPTPNAALLATSSDT